MTTSMTGGCLCGAVRYEAIGPARALTLFHCTSCRLAAGAPSLAWAVFESDGFRFTAGAPTTFASSPGVTRGFCGACGTSLTYQRTTRADAIDVTTASLDDPNAFAPTKEIWVGDKLAWEALNPSIAHFAASSVGATPLAD